MSQSGRMIWVDLEMTGLDVERERIIEAAVLVTNAELEIIAEGPNLVIHQSDELVASMDEWNTRHHGESGLTQRVRASTVTEEEAEAELLAFVSAHTAAMKAPLAGNSIHQDRLFLSRYMPTFTAHCHYRLVDVSSVKELVSRWYPDEYAKRPSKKASHRALDDIRESIAELRYYREVAFK
ncbi:MAG: oligoribonuclease [Deltaproteobacteria bacterium]|nr:oligoribonuclease [Deltaproteobacteria bacterium]